MIAKHIAMRSVKKSDYHALINYITDDDDKERVLYTAANNCNSTEIDLAVLEIMGTQNANVKAKSDKTYHLIISFREGEFPDKKTLQAIEEAICQGLGYGEHQRISAVHSDTDNIHMHIAINKIHPKKLTLHTPYYDYKVLGNLCQTLEAQYGLQKDNHSAVKTVSENKALSIEHKNGTESLLSWIRRECLDALKTATSWNEFNSVLDKHGLQLKERGNGYVFIDNNTGDMIKASTVDRALSKSQLEKRFNSVNNTHKLKDNNHPVKHYKPLPVNFQVDTTQLYEHYLTDANTKHIRLKSELAASSAKKDRLINELKRTMRIKRGVIKLVKSSRAERAMLKAVNTKEFERKLKAIRATYNQEKKAIFKKNKHDNWLLWLQREALNGNEQAMTALRSRTVADGLHGNIFKTGTGRKQSLEGSINTSHVTKHGTIIYRTDDLAVRDDGDKLSISRESTDEGLIIALQLAKQKYGRRIAINGTDAFKARVVNAAIKGKLDIEFSNSELEKQRKLGL